MTRLLSTVCAALLLAVITTYRHHPQVIAPATVSGDELHFAPAEDLEDADLAAIASAQHTIDVAMYAFTDQRIARALAAQAERGVLVLIYRDREQYLEERKRGGGVMPLLSGLPNLHIRVKHSTVLMHEKAVLIDGVLLREGSANWSFAGESRQDNTLWLTRNPALANAFATEFGAMWGRSDNEVIQ